MQRVCLINSPSLRKRAVSRSMAGGLGFDGDAGIVLPPLDLAVMAATLRNAGCEVKLIDADPLGLDDFDVCAELAGGEYTALIASVSLPTLDNDSGFIAGLKRRHPEAQVFAKTLVRDQSVLKELLRKSGAHLVIHGEADLSIPRIIAGEVRDGTAWLEGEELVFKAGEPVSDLNALPFPARDLLPNERYIYPLLGSPVATLQTSRGCPFPCAYYCPYPLVEGKAWRSQKPERIFAELKEVVERWGIHQIYFRDATFTLDQERVARLCDLIIAAGWGMEWMCETRVDCLTDELLEKMKAAGCVGMLIGVETGDENVMRRKEGKRGLTVEKLARLRERTRQLGLKLHFLLMVGLPHETRESTVATYDLIMRHDPDTIGVTIITPYPGTPLYHQGRREGWIDSYDWRDYGAHQVVMHTPHLAREDLVAAKNFVEGGFALLQRERAEGGSPQWQQRKKQHYLDLLRWAYQLDEVQKRVQGSGFKVASSTPASQPPAPHRQPPRERDGVLISVVIPTRNRRNTLRKTLLAFSSQTVEPKRFEVVVVDDGSTDDTLAMLKKLRTAFPLRVLSQEHQGANAARNLGIQQAGGWVVLLTGDDMVPGPFLLEEHLKFHRRHEDERDAMLGFIEWSPEIKVTPLMHYIVSPEGGQQFAFHAVQGERADFRLFYTSNISLKRDFLLKQAGLFDTDFTYPAFDDTELGYRLERQGLRLHHRPPALTYHHHEISVAGFVQRQRNVGAMAVVFARKHPELDGGLLGVEDVLNSPNRPDENALQGLLEVVLELEKPDPGKLGAIQMNGEGFDAVYARTVLHPLYNALLRTAYVIGVVEGERAWREREARKALEQAEQTRRVSGAGEFDVSIIVPCYNKLDYTQQCLAGLVGSTPEAIRYEVILVDNASTDGTQEFLASVDGDVQVITNPVNLGFAKACNQGARAARGKRLLFLNNDTVPLQGWLEAMLETLDSDDRIAVVGSKLLYPDGRVQHAGMVVKERGEGEVQQLYHVYRYADADAPWVNRQRDFQCVTGACYLIRREVFEAAGGFDEGFLNGYEDVDLSFKVREQGYRIVYCPRSVLYHYESVSEGRSRHEAENALRLHHRWVERVQPDEREVYAEDGFDFVETPDGRRLTLREAVTV